MIDLSPLNADTPVERDGKLREHVRLLTYINKQMNHNDFCRIGDYINAGDLLVFNNSRTIPAVLHTKDGTEVRLSRQRVDGTWDALVPLRCPVQLFFQKGISAKVIGDGTEYPLKRLRFSCSASEFFSELYVQGDVIRYEHTAKDWPLSDYQTVYATLPGSVEMPSAGRAFSWRLLNELKGAGVQLEFITLHAGLSYYGKNRWPTPSLHPESYIIGQKQAELINRTKAAGGRIIAVGTTVVRAIESASDKGMVVAREGETSLFIKGSEQLTMIDGLLTGFHEEEASHIQLLEAFVGKEGVATIYEEAINNGYLWHEFGDMNLLFKEALV